MTCRESLKINNLACKRQAFRESEGDFLRREGGVLVMVPNLIYRASTGINRRKAKIVHIFYGSSTLKESECRIVRLITSD